jgi:hypothetical protein
MRKNLIATLGCAAALALGAAGAAQATVVYTLSIDHCSSGCGPAPYGTISVTSNGTGLDVLVQLAPNEFVGGGLYDLTWDITGGPNITVTNISAVDFTFLNAPTGAPDTFHQNGFGDWQYAIDYTGPGGGPLGVQTLSFTITGAGTNESIFAPVYDTTDGVNVYWTADIYSASTGFTGPVGAPLGGIPEPATWLMMIAGIGLVGAALRRRSGIQPAFA